MKEESRTSNVLKNTSITLICHIIFIVSSFVCRTIFTKELGEEYLGIAGLFSNILTILSFAELGLGSTLVYRLYKPIAEKNYNKINLYIKLYKKIYHLIIIIILLIGLSIMPFLHYLVEAPNVKENLSILYVLHLLYTVTSYLFVYKKTLLTANQKDYIVSLFNELFNVLMNISQCLLLICFKNYIGYMLLSILFGILNNIACSIYVEKKYKYLKNDIKGKLDKNEIESLKKDTIGLMMTKVASTVFSGTDNIFISAFIGIKYVGILSNYTLIFTTVNSMMNKIFNSITASIGNLAITSENNDKAEYVLFKLVFINTTIYSYICIGMMLLIREFVTNIWLSNSFYLSYWIVSLTVIELFLRSIHFPLYTARNAFGLFSQYRIIFVISAILNIVLDFILIKPLGISGLLIATIICRLIIYIMDIHVLYKYGLKKSSKYYYLNIFKWILFTIVCYIICYLLISRIPITNIVYFIIKCIIITIVYAVLFLLFFSKSNDMKYFIKLIKNRMIKREKTN